MGEDRGGRAHGGDLQLLLGAEVREQPALAHLQLGREAADREPLEALDRRDVDRGGEDRAAGAVAADACGRPRRRARASRRRSATTSVKKVARSFVCDGKKHDRSFYLPDPKGLPMSPADIAAAELRAGLSRRLAELGLVPPDPAIFRVSALPAAAGSPGRDGAGRGPEGGMSAVAGLRGGSRTRPVLQPAAVLAVGVRLVVPRLPRRDDRQRRVPGRPGLVLRARRSPGCRGSSARTGSSSPRCSCPAGRLRRRGRWPPALPGRPGRVHGRLRALRRGAVGAAARRRARAPGRGRRAARARRRSCSSWRRSRPSSG